MNRNYVRIFSKGNHLKNIVADTRLLTVIGELFKRLPLFKRPFRNLTIYSSRSGVIPNRGRGEEKKRFSLFQALRHRTTPRNIFGKGLEPSGPLREKLHTIRRIFYKNTSYQYFLTYRQLKVAEELFQKEPGFKPLFEQIQVNSFDGEDVLSFCMGEKSQDYGLIDEKRRTLLNKFGDRIAKTWNKLYQVSSDCFLNVVIHNDDFSRYANMTAWRHRPNGWFVQANVGDPLYRFALQSFITIRNIGESYTGSHKKGIGLVDRFFGEKMVSALTEKYGEGVCDAKPFNFLLVPGIANRNTDQSTHVHSVSSKNSRQLFRFVEKHCGRAYALTEELDRPWREFEQLSRKFRKFGIEHNRFGLLCYSSEGNLQGALIGIYGTVAKHLSFCDNWQHLIIDPDLSVEDAVRTTQALLAKSIPKYGHWPMTEYPVLTNDAGKEALLGLGAEIFYENYSLFVCPQGENNELVGLKLLDGFTAAFRIFQKRQSRQSSAS